MIRTALTLVAVLAWPSAALSQATGPANAGHRTAATAPSSTIQAGTYDLEIAFGGGVMDGTLTIAMVGDSVDAGERFQVKRIGVKPGASLSLQKHHHRAEHWVVVRGTAEVTRGAETFLLSENQSTYIPIGEVHRLHNPGKMELEMIEVQSGAYLGEDDIVRLEDSYGRS